MSSIGDTTMWSGKQCKLAILVPTRDMVHSHFAYCLAQLMKTNFSYPDAQDPDIQYKLYTKREFYYNKAPERPELKSYQDIKEYRDNVCAKDFALHDQQVLISNIINPDTPLNGCIVFHGLGTGKCIFPDSKINLYNSNKIPKEYMLSLEAGNEYSKSIEEINKQGKWSNFYREATDHFGKKRGNHEVKAIRLETITHYE